MRPRPAPTFASTALVALASLLLVHAHAAPDDAQGALYRNADLGVRIQGPPGWRMVADRQGSSPWTRLVTFYDATTGTDAVLSRRDRQFATLDELKAWVEKEWRSDPAYQLVSLQIQAANALKPVPSIVADATHIAKEQKGAGPAVSVPYQIVASYWQGPKDEFLLYVKGKAATWSRVRGFVDTLLQGFTLETAGIEVPRGAGGYADDERGFTCRFPEGYSVHVPRRAQHVVDFTPVSGEDAVLGVYHFTWEGTTDKDAERLVAYYVNELAGEAKVENIEVSGRPGRLVTATANVGGKDQLFLLAVVQRDQGEFFRLRAALPRLGEAKGRQVFAAFLKSFKLGPRPR